MKLLFVVVALATVGLFSFCNTQKKVMPTPIGHSIWSDVDSLEKRGLPKSALEKTEEILTKARSENNWPETVKALIFRAKYQTQLDENGSTKAIQNLQNEADACQNPPEKAVLQSLLAQLYQAYLQNRGWQIRQRTPTDGPRSTDLETWSIADFEEKTQELFTASIQNVVALKAVQSVDYQLITTKSEADSMDGKPLRPTLFDFLANRAVEFFQNESNFLTEPVNRFHLSQPEAFGSAADFTAFNFETKDSASRKWLAIKVLQQILTAHFGETNPAPLVVADLARLDFARQNSTLEKKDELYLAALDQLTRQFSGKEIESEIALRRAKFYETDWSVEQGEAHRFDLRTSRQIAEDIVARFPKSYAATEAKLLIVRVLQKNLSLQIEKENAPDRPFLGLLHFRNLTQVHGRVCRISEADLKKIQSFQNEDERVQFYLKLPVLKTFEASIPDQNDHREHSTEIRLPALPIGQYMLLIADNQDFTTAKSSMIAACQVRITNLAAISQREGGQQNLFVADRTTGAPLAGVRAEFFETRWNNGDYLKVKIGEATSDKNGLVSSENWNERNLEILLSVKNDSLEAGNIYNYKTQPPSPSREATIFTDRSIYRPGQTIYFKTILVEKNEKGLPSILPNEAVVATFFDANYQKINELQLQTNEFGTANGAFIAPSSGLTGSMQISIARGKIGAIGDALGATAVQIEEYKRPRFEVKIEPIEGSVRLGERVTATGAAMNFAGSAVDGATVKYRVVRQTRWLYDFGWFGFGKGFPQTPEAEIANGETSTDGDGKFKISFDAQPDLDLKKADRPTFDYLIFVDVTDGAGETRSASRSVSIGYVAMQVETSLLETMAIDSLKSLKISTKNLSGQPVKAVGRLTIQKVEAPFFKDRRWPKPDVWSLSQADYSNDFDGFAYKNEDDPANFPRPDFIWATDFSSEKAVDLKEARLAAGVYEFKITTADAFGEKLEVTRLVTIFDKTSAKLPTASKPLFAFLEKQTAEPSETVQLFLGLKNDGNALISIQRPNQKNQVNWLKMNGLQPLTIAISEEDRGGVFVQILTIRDGRFYMESRQIAVPFSNKDLKIEYGVFRDKLTPGQPENWTLKISGAKGDKVVAEVLASMYDASLDQFLPHSWNANFYPTYWQSTSYDGLGFNTSYGNPIWNRPEMAGEHMIWRSFPELNFFDFPLYGNAFRGNRMADGEFKMAMPMMAMESSASGMGMAKRKGGHEELVMTFAADSKPEDAQKIWVEDPPSTQKPASPVVPRKNLQETAFFFPELRTDAAGNVVLKFTTPEALTRWKFMAFAHTKDLQFAFSEKEVVTQKELMVLPNPPRFLREGDEIEFVSKISNLSQANLKGTARLEIFDAISMQSLDNQFVSSEKTVAFSVGKNRSTTASWKLKVPIGRTEPIVWRISATAGNFTDGEENALPVVTNRMLVTETLPMSVRGGATKSFSFESMKNDSKTLKNQSFSLEFTPNPAWFAVQAMPYLMEFPHECSEQIMSRLFANSVAATVANSNPKIRAVFERWKTAGGTALQSNLAKNQELKNALLEETPWVLEAQNEAQQKQQIALLFDLNRMADERARAERQLMERQSPDGGFAWFPQGRSDWFITQNVVENFGHLKMLNALEIADNQEVMSMISKAIGFCDAAAMKDFEDIKRNSKTPADLEKDHLGQLEIQWLYARSFFPETDGLPQKPEAAFDYFINQAEKYWLGKNLQSQAMMALALHRFGKKDAAAAILKSLKERAQQSDELGMFWNFDAGFYWFELPIETQALLIEAFSEVADDAQSIENQRVWLLKNKQTNNWKTTKATSAAIYALLIGDSKWLDETKPVSIKLAGKPLSQTDVQPEAGTGYFKKTWSAEAVKTDFANIEVSNPNAGLAWGAAFWQYFEDIDKVKSFKATPLKLNRQFFKLENSPSGPILKPAENLKPGDKLKVRIELKCDRPMEFVHLKDTRASGFEPTDVLSGYRWQDGLGYYQSTKDLATHFFIDYLPKGTYVFEYQLVVQQRGDFSSGVSTIECMYAPEFSSHSVGGRLGVK